MSLRNAVSISAIVSSATLVVLAFQQPALAAKEMTLEEVLSLARDNSEAAQSASKTIESIRSEIRSRDLVLSPKLSSELADSRDDRDTLTPAQKFHTRFLDVSLTKLFSTGTEVSVSAGHDISETGANGTRNIGEWQVRLSQALWRDGFGRATTLRHQAEGNELQSRTFSAVNKLQSFYVDIEEVYWDLALALKEESIRQSNIEKSQTVERWTRDRVRRSTAEASDLLQAQALVSSRQLDLIDTRNRIETLRNRLKQLIPKQSPEVWTLDLKALEVARPLTNLLADASGSGDPVSLASLVASFASRQADYEASGVDDSLRPQLDAYVSYGQNGADERFGPAWNRAADPEYSSARVGVLLSMDLDWRLKNDRRNAARLSAEARELEARAQQRASLIGWQDLNRQVGELRKQVEEATRLAEIQEKKVAAERSRFRLGRTTVFQLITFEVDATEAQLRVFRLLSNLRKAEGQARLFTRNQDGI